LKRRGRAGREGGAIPGGDASADPGSLVVHPLDAVVELRCVLSCCLLPNRPYGAIQLQEPLKVPETGLLVTLQMPRFG
jgi:hypothetical protein